MFSDKHHILHNKVEWSARPQSKKLRESPPLVPLIDRDVHNELHRIAPAVPLLGYYALNRVAALYEPQPTTIGSIDNLLASILEASKHRKAHQVERGIADLAIQAIEIQRAILRGNIE